MFYRCLIEHVFEEKDGFVILWNVVWTHNKNKKNNIWYCKIGDIIISASYYHENTEAENQAVILRSSRIKTGLCLKWKLVDFRTNGNHCQFTEFVSASTHAS